nr:hypothetical protein BV87_23830 [Sphingobium yanoikuyae]
MRDLLVDAVLGALFRRLLDRFFEHALQHPTDRESHRRGDNGASCGILERAKELFAALASILTGNEVGYFLSFAHSITSWFRS